MSDPTTLRLALLGDPVSHSRSPAIHRAALRALGIDGGYETRRTGTTGLLAACGEMRAGTLNGFNVTMPLKRVAVGAVDDVSELAHRADAVNTAYLRDGSVWGDNTDVGGICDAWDRRGLPVEAPVLVLGTGGAAAAALLALQGADIVVSSRRSGAGMSLASKVGVMVSEVAWGTAVGGAVVVNATPIGMKGDALPAGIVDVASGLFDMAYGPTTTPAVSEAGAIPVVDGIDMLVAQAAISFAIWTGRAAPIEEMERAAREGPN